ncbi:MAG: integration host factor subunit beta [Bacteroidetes bacterium RIFOXYA12_FULL_35_11]|nr:MAG: integration host factor subunit beta [Bacteroidetes bacterium GWF2_35_48]OFY74973.1 MAG: integration host factor subunit beta [Bacteroidetes bacterium RIFOXYA12_FULL_35_11]OFY92685.1 MAG: integration host factor subunit beta [Bacteroidetes bacterium RIFOXYC12_FULL_35_7]OFY97385.1 MAG: integration host factor subunit beta [Bacteroidetes bacterium RIFOXYB2_FULL_35_7]HBX53209.1 integration host factor subunit beta [Bacteroidales bacterium]
MTKADLVQEISKTTGIEKQLVSKILETYMEQLKSNMIQGQNIFFRGFGSFTLKKRAEKAARNISKNTTVVIPAHYIPVFKPCDEFKKEVAEKVKD